MINGYSRVLVHSQYISSERKLSFVYRGYREASGQCNPRFG